MPGYAQRFSTFILVLLTLAAGCGDDDTPRHEVSGTVTYDGKPVPIGTIAFEPTRQAGKHAATGFAIIRDGTFRTEADKGAGAGPYLVRITAGDGEADSSPPEIGLDPDQPAPPTPVVFGNYLFDEYTKQVELPAENSSLKIDIPAM